jgi:3-deoxy-manno-octulosonate cytidylyltransferase (CMP-KDO synthetase)
MTDFTVIIPARHASSRFPGKPLVDVAGKPMVVRVAERARRSGAREVLVATDHPDIAAAVEQHGFIAIMTRRSHASGTDRLAEVVARRRYPDAHVVVNVQGDEPLIQPALIRQVAANLVRQRGAHIATACTPIRDARDLADPNIVKVVLDNRCRALYFSRAPVPFARDAFALRRRSSPPTFAGLIRAIPRGLPAYRHLGIYAYRCAFLKRFSRLKPAAIERFEALEQLRALAHGFRINVVVTRGAPHPGIDTPRDLQRLRLRLRA